MKMSLLISIILTLGFFCCSCESSKSNKAELDEAKKELESYTFTEHDNLRFECAIPAINADDIYILTMKSRFDSPDNDESRMQLRDLLNNAFGADVAFEDTILMDSGGTVECAYKEKSPGGTYFKASHTFELWNYPDTYKFGRETDPKRSYRTYSVNEIPADTFTMFDGSRMTASEAEEYAQSCLEKLRYVFNEDASWKLEGVCIEQIEGQDNTIFLRYEHILCGLPVSDEAYITDDTTRDTILCPQLQLQYAGRDKLISVFNRYHCIIDKKEKLTEIIPLSEAEKLASRELAPNLKYTVSEADLKYVCKTRQGEDVRIYRPMWSFTLKAYPPVESSRDLFPRLVCFVDAADGTVYLSDGFKGELSEFLTEC